MGKIFDEQSMRFEITNDKLKMEITLKELARLFETSPSNGCSKSDLITVKRGKRKEFAEYIVGCLLDDSKLNDNNVSWGDPFESAFEDLFENYEDDICNYPDEE